MDKNILLQKQVRDNSEDLRAYLNDLVQWEEEMKRKESQISSGSGEPEVPVVRNKAKKIEEIKGRKTVKDQPIKKISSYDYAAWDKFDVDAECEKIDANKEESEVEDDPSEEYKTRLRDEATYEKERGNQFVKNKNWDEAISCYTHSIACYSKDPIYFANRALCFLKKNELHSAEADCTSALQLDPSYVKALQRRAAAREGLKQYHEALEDLKKVLELEPHNKESKQELDKLEKRLGIYKQKSSNNTVKQTTCTVINKTSKEKPKNETSDVPKEAIKSKPVISKQIQWPKRPDSEIVLPIQKLPHQRSKKSLRKIDIQESDNNDITSMIKSREIKKIDKHSNTSISNINYDENNSLAKILAQSKELNIDEVLKNIENDIKRPEIKTETIEKSENKSLQKKIEESSTVFDYPLPKSSIQFCFSWKKMKNNNDHKFLYLKNINPVELPNIFRESLESDIFSEIIFILSEYFIENKLEIFPYLKNLSCVKRFSALTMFMSSKDKIGLKKLFEYCENTNGLSIEEINLLRKKYEL